MKRALGILRSTPVKVTFLVLALAAAVWAVAAQWGEVQSSLRQMDPVIIIGAVAVSLLYVLATMLSWRAVLRDLGSIPAPLAGARIFLISQLGKYLPGGVWNIVAAAELGSTHRIPARRSVSAMLVTTLISLVTGLLLALVSVPFAPAELVARFGWAFWFFPLFVLLLLPPVLNRLLGVMLRFLRKPGLESPLSWSGITLAVWWALVAWVIAGVQVWLLGVGLGAPAHPMFLVQAVGGYGFAWSVGFLVVVVPAGAGVREAVLGIVLGSVLPAGAIVVLVLLSRVLFTIADLVLGGLGLVIGRHPAARTLTEPESAEAAVQDAEVK